MCLTETYSRVQVGKNLSDMFPVRNAFQLCFGVCHQEGSGEPGWLEIKWTHQLLAYADDVNILGGSVHTVEENAEALVVAKN